MKTENVSLKEFDKALRKGDVFFQIAFKESDHDLSDLTKDDLHKIVDIDKLCDFDELEEKDVTKIRSIFKIDHGHGEYLYGAFMMLRSVNEIHGYKKVLFALNKKKEITFFMIDNDTIVNRQINLKMYKYNQTNNHMTVRFFGRKYYIKSQLKVILRYIKDFKTSLQMNKFKEKIFDETSRVYFKSQYGKDIVTEMKKRIDDGEKFFIVRHFENSTYHNCATSEPFYAFSKNDKYMPLKSIMPYNNIKECYDNSETKTGLRTDIIDGKKTTYIAHKAIIMPHDSYGLVFSLKEKIEEVDGKMIPSYSATVFFEKGGLNNYTLESFQDVAEFRALQHLVREAYDIEVNI